MLLSSAKTEPKPQAAAVVKDVELATFMADVVEGSRERLVLVNFWSGKSAACKQFTPILEKLVRTYKGSVSLAKVEFERSRPLAQQLGVQSVPAVFAFYQGRPVDGFMGTMPEPQMKTWLDQILKATSKSNPTADLEQTLKEANDFLAAKDINSAQAIFGEILNQDPANPSAYAGLLRCLLALGDHAKAKEMLAAAPAAMVKDKAFDPVRTAFELLEQSSHTGSVASQKAKVDADGSNLEARYDLAMAHYAAGEREAAVDQLLEIIRRQRSWNEDAARKQLVKFFEAFGAADPLTIASRKKLSAILFS